MGQPEYLLICVSTARSNGWFTDDTHQNRKLCNKALETFDKIQSTLQDVSEAESLAPWTWEAPESSSSACPSTKETKTRLWTLSVPGTSERGWHKGLCCFLYFPFFPAPIWSLALVPLGAGEWWGGVGEPTPSPLWLFFPLGLATVVLACTLPWKPGGQHIFCTFVWLGFHLLSFFLASKNEYPHIWPCWCSQFKWIYTT